MDGEGSHYNYIHACNTTKHVHQELLRLLKQFRSTIRAHGTRMVRCGLIFCFAPRAEPFVVLSSLVFHQHRLIDENTPDAGPVQPVGLQSGIHGQKFLFRIPARSPFLEILGRVPFPEKLSGRSSPRQRAGGVCKTLADGNLFLKTTGRETKFVSTQSQMRSCSAEPPQVIFAVPRLSLPPLTKPVDPPQFGQLRPLRFR